MCLHWFVQWCTWTYTSFLPLYLKSCHVLLKPLCLAQKGGFSLTPMSCWGGRSLLCCLLCLPSPCCSHSPSACAGVVAPSPVPAGQQGRKPRAGRSEPAGRKLLAGNQKEELCHRPLGGGERLWDSPGFVSWVCSFCWGRYRAFWIWSDLHYNNDQKNLLALCLGSGFIIARAGSQQATSCPPKSTSSLGRTAPSVLLTTFSLRPAKEHFWGSLTGMFPIQQNCCIQGKFLGQGGTASVSIKWLTTVPGRWNYRCRLGEDHLSQRE